MKKMINALAAIGLLAFGSAHAGHVMVSDAWVREAPPGAAALAGYMTVMNHSGEARALVAASSPAFGHVMLHRTVMEEGVAKMVHQMRVELPANGTVTFEPSGYHLMMMKPKQALKAGDVIPVTIEFANGEMMEVEYQVKGMGSAMGDGGMDHGQMDHGHH